jgi:hypothetical protein
MMHGLTNLKIITLFRKQSVPRSLMMSNFVIPKEIKQGWCEVLELERSNPNRTKNYHRTLPWINST